MVVNVKIDKASVTASMEEGDKIEIFVNDKMIRTYVVSTGNVGEFKADFQSTKVDAQP